MFINVVLIILLMCFERDVFGAPVDEQFFSSCRKGDVAAVKAYLDSGVPAHARDSKGNSGLVIASGRGNLEVIRLLLSYKANPEDGTAMGIFEGKTAICWASSQGRVDAVALLMQAGADAQQPPSTGVFAGKNALMWAASQGRTEVIRFLLSAGAEVDFSSQSGNFKGKTALMWASSQGRFDTVQVLLEAGANVNAVDNDGLSALMWASGSEATGNDDHKKGLLEKALKGHIQVVQLLLRYGAQVDLRDKDLITAIMFASFNGHDGAVRVLLNAGADADFVNKDGKTALQLARGSRHTAVVETILLGPSFLNATLLELRELTVCGWLLAVLRAPTGTGKLFRREYLNRTYVSEVSIDRSCRVLKTNGFDTSLYDLFTLRHASSVDNIISGLGHLNLASKIRAKMELELLYKKHHLHFEELWGVSSSSNMSSCSALPS